MGNIYFEDFGKNFFYYIFTPQIIAQETKKNLPTGRQPIPRMNVNSLIYADGFYEIDVGNIRSDNPISTDYYMTFNLSIPIHLIIYVHLAVGQENYEVDTTANLPLNVTAFPPLTIQILKEQIGANRISIDKVTGEGNWFNAAQSALPQNVQNGIAAEINKRNVSRTIDVYNQVMDFIKNGSV